MNYKFEIEELDVGSMFVYVRGEVEYDVEKGESGTYMDPPSNDFPYVEEVHIESVLCEDGDKAYIPEKDVIEYVKGWFEGDEGIERLLCNYGSWCAAEEEARADAMRFSV